MTARQCFKKKMAFSHTDPENPWTPTPPLHDHTNILQQILNLTPLEKFNFFFWKGGRGGGLVVWSPTGVLLTQNFFKNGAAGYDGSE
jgi:hypothetical protein